MAPLIASAMNGERIYLAFVAVVCAAFWAWFRRDMRRSGGSKKLLVLIDVAGLVLLATVIAEIFNYRFVFPPAIDVGAEWLVIVGVIVVMAWKLPSWAAALGIIFWAANSALRMIHEETWSRMQGPWGNFVYRHLNGLRTASTFGLILVVGPFVLRWFYAVMLRDKDTKSS